MQFLLESDCDKEYFFQRGSNIPCWKAYIDSLQKDLLLGQASSDEQGFIVPCCSSSFDVLAKLYRAGKARAWSWVLAAEQSQGRGQYSRSWQSRLGGLYVSQILGKLKSLQEHLSLLPIFLVLELRNYLCELDPMLTTSLLLKWPNDLVLLTQEGAQKVGGLLVEQRQNYTVFGLGLNFTAVAAVAGPALEPGYLNWDALSASHAAPQSLPELWACFSSRLQRAWSLWQKQPPKSQAINTALAFYGEEVELIPASDAKVEVGRLLGIGSSGELLLAQKTGTARFYSGSLRPRKRLSHSVRLLDPKSFPRKAPCAKKEKTKIQQDHYW